MTRRANLLTIAQERGLVPILLLPRLFREGWHAPADQPELQAANGDPDPAAERLAYERPESIELEVEGSVSLLRLAIATEDCLPPGVNRQGRPMPETRSQRAKFAASMLRRSGALLEGMAQSEVTLGALCIGFEEAALACAPNRPGRSAALLAEQFAGLTRGKYGCGLPIPMLPERLSPEWEALRVECLDSWVCIAEAARLQAEKLQDGRERSIYEGLAAGWLLECQRLQQRIRKDAGGARA